MENLEVHTEPPPRAPCTSAPNDSQDSCSRPRLGGRQGGILGLTMLVISCHADTGFQSHRLRRLPGGAVEGHLDNFAGCHAVMQAYFSGRMDFDRIRIELTWGEEVGLLGAKELVGAL